MQLAVISNQYKTTVKGGGKVAWWEEVDRFKGSSIRIICIIFGKTKFSYLLIHILVCAYQGDVSFSENVSYL